MATDNNGNTGIIAVLLVIVMLMIGGFLYFQMREEPAEVSIELPDVDVDGRDEGGR